QRRDFDISTAAIYVTVQRSKGSDKTRHQLPSAIADLVREHVRDMKSNDYLFKGNRRTSVSRTLSNGKEVGAHIAYTTFYQAFIRYCRMAGIPESLHFPRSEEHTSELQSRFDLVCRLLLEINNTTVLGIAGKHYYDDASDH